MLKELVTSIFCCFPHHHDAPVVERITPIFAVSDQPYSLQEYRNAISEQRFDDALKIGVKGFIEDYGQENWSKLEDLCEQFAQEKLYLTNINYDQYDASNDAPVQQGRELVGRGNITEINQPLRVIVYRTYSKGYGIKGLYFYLISGAHGQGYLFSSVVKDGR